MTAQATHSFEYHNEVWHLLNTSQDFGGHIVPPEFTLKTFDFSTAGGPGYHINCGLDENQLIVRHFQITGAVLQAERHEDGNPRFLRTEGSRTDWESDRRWQVFSKLPSINGQLPEVQIIKVSGVRFSKKENYTVTDPETYLDPYEAERVDYSTYSDLNLPVNFTGGMLLATDGAHALHPLPNGYKRVLEVTFRDGVLTDVTDQSELVRSIVAGAERTNAAMIDAMERRRDDLPHFTHIYTLWLPKLGPLFFPKLDSK